MSKIHSNLMDFAMLHYYALICLIIFSLVPLHVFSQISSSPNNVNTITLGSSLTATKSNANNPWKTSPSGDFAFGFIQPPGTVTGTGTGGGYLLAIWFNKIPGKTIIWSANRNTLAPEGSRIQLLQNGRFVLNDPTGQNIWAANTGGAEAANGVMLDTGNFVLASNTSSTLWQSFDTPTDTLLPSQMLNQGQIIVSSFSPTNYSSGKFQLTNDSNGNLVFYRTTDDPLAPFGFPFSGTPAGSFLFGNGSRYLFNQSGTISIVARNGSLIYSEFFSFETAVSTNQYYQRLTLDYDGVLRHYAYPKSPNSTGGMPMAWSILEYKPQNICLSDTRAPGGGICGYNGLCVMGSDQKPVCQCPGGYSFIDSNDTMIGCKRDFVPQNCMRDETEVFELIDVFNCNWNVNEDLEHFTQVTEDWCRQVCLNDCLCAAAFFQDSSCYKRYSPLINGRIDSGVKGKTLIKIRRPNSTISDDTRNHKRGKVIIIVGSTLLGGSLLMNMLILCAALFFGNWFKKKAYTLVPTNPVLSGLNIRSFSYHELEEATNGFTEELGSGACSVVYKGTLKHEGMELVAVKKLRNMVKEGDHEFNAEVSSISRTNHKNLVQLLGYCNEGSHRLLVYEYMSNGSLASFLFDNPRPNWYKRVQIATTTASGLYYLHEECSSQIIHCDIKPQNVLLDESLTVKISDFGLAKLLKQDHSKTTTEIRGTRGYVAPEWFRNMPITSKVDVYSFGILLLELVCCRKNIEINVGDEKEVILSDWAYDCYDEKKLHLLITNDEEAINDLKRVEKFVSIALWCIQEEPSLRPSMKRVVQMLEGSIHVSVPPNPSSFISSIS